MNIVDTEVLFKVRAKTCSCCNDGNKENNSNNRKKVTYSFIDAYHSLCLDKKDIISAETAACERLLEYTVDETDRKAIEMEIAELKMAIDLMSR
jgi:hypothetical protein